MGRRRDQRPDPEGGGFWLDDLSAPDQGPARYGDRPPPPPDDLDPYGRPRQPQPAWDPFEDAPAGGAPGGRGPYGEPGGRDPYGEPGHGPDHGNEDGQGTGRAELRRSDKLRRRRNRRRRVRGVIVLLLLIGVVGTGAYGAFRLTSKRPPKFQPGQPVSLTVQPGQSSLQIGRALERAGVVDSAGRFRAVAGERGLDGALKPGAYQLETVMDIDSVIDILVRGSNVGTPFTVPEGFTAAQIVDKIAATKRFSKPSLQKALAAPGLEVPFRPKGVKTLEGLLFPQTYRIDKDASAGAVVQQMLDQLDSVMSRFDLTATPRHLSPYEILTIASMIEREAKVAGDRPKIARVIYNRLAKRQPLQIDATVQYALGTTRPRLSTKDLQVDSPYNSYLHAGLPPTPIASPGEASIEAAMEPADGPWLFYVLIDKDGHHAFTDSGDEFARLKAEARRKGLL